MKSNSALVMTALLTSLAFQSSCTLPRIFQSQEKQDAEAKRRTQTEHLTDEERQQIALAEEATRLKVKADAARQAENQAEADAILEESRIAKRKADRAGAKLESARAHPWYSGGMELVGGTTTFSGGFFDDVDEADEGELEVGAFGFEAVTGNQGSGWSGVFGLLYNMEDDLFANEFFYGGWRYSTSVIAPVYPYVGLGGTLLMLDYTGGDSIQGEEEFAVGGFANGGVAFNLTDGLYVAAEVRKVFASVVDDMDQVLFRLGFAF
ncbi:MAG: hypothetical protein ACI841_004132 [Planctomycetota bacterium]|jgi:hypothetical protein